MTQSHSDPRTRVTLPWPSCRQMHQPTPGAVRGTPDCHPPRGGLACIVPVVGETALSREGEISISCAAGRGEGVRGPGYPTAVNDTILPADK